MAAYNGLLEKQSSLIWNSHFINFVSFFFLSFFFFHFFRLSLIGCKNRRVVNILPLKNAQLSEMQSSVLPRADAHA